MKKSTDTTKTKTTRKRNKRVSEIENEGMEIVNEINSSSNIEDNIIEEEIMESTEIVTNNIIEEDNNPNIIDSTTPTYSPAPWSWDYDDESEFILDANNEIVNISGANKMLMALAPEMYELLKDCVSIDPARKPLDTNRINHIINVIDNYKNVSYTYYCIEPTQHLIRIFNCKNLIDVFLNKINYQIGEEFHDTENITKIFNESGIFNNTNLNKWCAKITLDITDGNMSILEIKGWDEKRKDILLINACYKIMMVIND